MNRKQQGVVLAGLLALALAGCSSTRGSSDEMGAGTTSSGTGGSSSMGSGTSGSGTSGSATSSSSGGTAATGGAADTSSGSMAGTGSSPSAGQTQAPAGSSMMPSGPPNAVVVLIEAMPRPSSAGAGSAVGGSGTGGATGSSTGDEKMYRITLRMDDGTTRVVTQEKLPDFRSGDRVNMMDGMISR